RGRERRRRRPPLEPRVPARNHALDLRLLQHHLADEDRVRIGGPTPREIPPVLAEPGQQQLAHVVAVSLPKRDRRALPGSPLSFRRGCGSSAVAQSAEPAASGEYVAVPRLLVDRRGLRGTAGGQLLRRLARDPGASARPRAVQPVLPRAGAERERRL